MIVDLPEPEGPTIAVVSPALIEKDASSRTGLNSAGYVGYLKVTFLKSIDLFSWNPIPLSQSLSFLISGTLSMTSKMSAPHVLAATTDWMFGNAPMRPTNPVINAITTVTTSFC